MSTLIVVHLQILIFKKTLFEAFRQLYERNNWSCDAIVNAVIS